MCYLRDDFFIAFFILLETREREEKRGVKLQKRKSRIFWSIRTREQEFLSGDAKMVGGARSKGQ